MLKEGIFMLFMLFHPVKLETAYQDPSYYFAFCVFLFVCLLLFFKVPAQKLAVVHKKIIFMEDTE